MAALKGKALIAYLLVCVVWGSTYLVIRIGVAELPPFMFAGLRFFAAGLLLLGGALLFGDRLPRDPQVWRVNAIVGAFLFAGGNSLVVWAEQFISSGLASVFVVTVALWMALFDALVPGGKSVLSWRVVVGLAIGFVGTMLLVGATPRELLSADLRGPVALTLASASWAFGSVYYKRRPSATSPYVAAAIQMGAGGALTALFGVLLGEAGSFHMTATGAWSMAYLALFGSIVGFTAYVYALKYAPATIVGTYAYVNPVIAVLLGWWILHEAVTGRTFVAMGLILGAVVWIQFSDVLQRRRNDGMTERHIPSFRPSVDSQ
jgi:drug/metabolite transporter (DMT)-like permease